MPDGTAIPLSQYDPNKLDDMGFIIAHNVLSRDCFVREHGENNPALLEAYEQLGRIKRGYCPQ